MDNLSNVEAVFFAALEKGSPEERTAYLDEACGGDVELRRTVERLLSAHPEVGSFLQSPALAGTAEVSPNRESPGMKVGPYKLLQRIGEGGMGTVYMAEQEQPIRRLVAVKIIKPGLESAEVLARFEAERQALALMEHPNVAKVLDAGATDGGLPYFVMELIHGIPITDYCNQRRLSPRERLELFIPVCQAVQHAHQKAIIHRDLKPSNVLVALYDGRPVPKVIDFGVAKATGQKLTERTLVTRFGALVGTIEYMSPEQAELNQLDVDTRSDVYSLGVLLYELLTGETPLGRQRLEEAGLLEMLRRVREEEPPSPSNRLSSSPELPALSEQRSMEPARLARLVRGELDWIVMKTLEKDRSRRYATAAGLTEDIQRYLDDELVQAGPPSAGYRLRKFLKRNRGLVLAAAGVFVTLVAGAIGTTLGLMRAMQSMDVAQGLARDLKGALEDSQKNEQAAKFQALRAESARHAIQLDLALRAWERHDVAEAERMLGEVDAAFEQTWEQRHLRELCRRKALTLPGVPLPGPSQTRSLVKKPEPTAMAILQTKATPIKPEDTQRSPGHERLPSGVTFSADGRFMVSWCDDRTVKVWETTAGRQMLTLEGGASGERVRLALSPDGKRIALSWGERPLEVWDVATQRKMHILKGTNRSVRVGVPYGHGVTFSPDNRHVAVENQDGTVTVWDAATGQEQFTCKGVFLAFSRDGRLMAKRSYVWDRSEFASGWVVSVVDTLTGQEKFSRKGTPFAGSEVCSAAFSPDGRSIVLGWRDGTVRVWDAVAGREKSSRKGHKAEINAVALSSNGQIIISASMDGLAKVWDAATGQEKMTFLAAGGERRSVATISPDGRFIALVSSAGTEVWDATSGEDRFFLPAQPDTVLGVTFLGDAPRIVTGSKEGTMRVYDPAAEQAGRTLQDGLLDGVYSVAISPDGRLIAAGGHFNTLKVWDALTGQGRLVREVKEGDPIDMGPGGKSNFRGPVVGVCFSPDSRRLVAATKDKTVRVWDVRTGQEVLTLRGHEHMVENVLWSLDGRRIASSSMDGTLRVWDAQTGQPQLCLTVFEGGGADPGLLAISPDGGSVVARGRVENVPGPDGKLLPREMPGVLDAATGEVKLTLQGRPAKVRCSTFSPDGQRIVTGEEDGTIRIWDAATGEEQMTLKGHTGAVFSVAFSWDGQRIVSGGNGKADLGQREPGELKVWDAVTGQEKLTLKGHAGAVLGVAFSRDGQRIISGSADGTVRVWEAPAADLRTQR